ncbi:MAG: Ig-like domain-containing protein, partial [Eubacteriales bacterium]|nr:Ig-like domain-containing protein [Eubacteriales bacterium]
MSADPAVDIPADGASSAAITATIQDGSGEAVVQGTSVTFSTTLGVFPDGSTTYTRSTENDSGVVVVALKSSIAGEARVTASSSGTSQGVTVQFIAVPDVPATLSLQSSKTTVASNGSDNATITAVVLAKSNAVIKDVTVSFSSFTAGETPTAGQLSASNAVTDADGKASVTFSSGPDKANHYVSIGASVFGIEEQRYVNVEITGTTVALSADTTNIEVGASAVPLGITVSDAGGTVVKGAPVTLTVSPAGRVTLSKQSGNTKDNGRLDVEILGTASGTVTITAQSLGAEASRDFVVGEPGFVFGITSPEEDPASLYTGSFLPIGVNAPDQEKVLFVTTVGELTGGGGTGRVITVPVSGGRASAVLSSDTAGVATVWVMDERDSFTSDSLKVDIYPPVSESSQIALQASPTVIETNAGDINTSTLVATVKNADDQIIKGAPVVFSMERATGGGEFISPSIAYTNKEGKATATFTSGSLSSDATGVKICASVAGIPAAGSSCASIIIGGTAGAVTITHGTVIESTSNDTTYRLPMSVLVSDSDGNPVKGTAVSLGVWPTRCATGYWEEVEENKCEPRYECVLDNEDANRNLILDPGEDGNGDGFLTPPISAAGEIPPYVTTDENGVATFDLVYLKSSAVWVETEVTATTLVLGTETKSTFTFWLPYLKDEACHLPHSPFHTKSVTLVAAPSTLAADGSSLSTVTAIVTDALDRPANGEIVTFSVTSGTGTVNPAFDVTANGIAQTTYRASSAPGTETITATVLGSECASATADITLTPADFPTADFESADLGDQNHVLFTDASEPSGSTKASIVSWSWTFRRASGTVVTTSAAQNPGSVSLGSSGFYVVELTVTDALGARDTVIKAVEVKSQTVPPTAPTADFNWTDLGDGDHVLFTDDSTAVTGTTLTSWSW